MTDRTIALAALFLAVLSIGLGAWHALTPTPPAHTR